MKVIERQTTVDTVGVQDSVQFSVQQEDLQYIFAVLRNNLYSNKPLAILREYSCNAYDSHDLAGWSERPIQITMPTPFDPTLRIRDFGTGLSQEDVMKVYSSYGKSTKRDSNTQIGQMGIGSKSAFCYGNSFSIVSFFEGTRTLYEAFIDQSGIGMISKLMDEPTTEENGVEIAVKVKPNDIHSFTREAKSFFKHFTPRPVIYNSDEVVRYLDSINDTPIRQGDGWYILEKQEYSTNITVIMGNIAYPCKMDIFDKDDIEEAWITNTTRKEIVIKVGIGDIKFSASRESLEYHDLTVKVLREKIRQVYRDIVSSIEVDISTAPNLWEARKLLSTHASIFNSTDFTPIYKGVRLVNTWIDNKIIEGLHVTVSTLQAHNKRIKPGGGIQPSENPIILLNQGDFPRQQLSGRVRLVFSENPNRQIRIVTGSITAIDAFKTNENFVGAEMIDLASVNYVVVKKARAKYGSKGGSTVDPKRKIAVFKYNGSVTHPRSYAWDACEIDAKTDCVYITIKSFAPFGDNGTVTITKLDELNTLLNEYKQVAGSALTLYGVREGTEDIPSNWVRLDKFMTSVIESQLVNPDIIARRKADAYRDALSENFKCCSKIASDFPDGLLKTILVEYKTLEDAKLMGTVQLNYLCRLAASCGYELIRADHEASEKIKQAEAQYGMLHVSESYYRTADWVAKNAKTIQEYVEMIEKCANSTAQSDVE